MTLIRAVESGDLKTICGHRRHMFAENSVSEETLDLMDDSFAAWLAPRLADGSYFGFVAEVDGVVVGGVGLRLIDWPPSPLHPTREMRGYILNVFVEQAYRGRGIARELMQRAEADFRARGVTYETLHASAMGRPVYEKLGWSATMELGKALR